SLGQGTTAQKLSVFRPVPPLHTSKPAKTLVRYQLSCSRPALVACWMKSFKLKVYSFMLLVGTQVTTSTPSWQGLPQYQRRHCLVATVTSPRSLPSGCTP